MEQQKTFSMLDLINLIKSLRDCKRLSEDEANMITSFLAKYLHLEIKIEEYKFKLNER